MVNRTFEPGEPPPNPGDENSAESAHYYGPQRRSDPLNGRTTPPVVKRFNRKTVGVLAAVGALVTILALGTALTRPRHGRQISEAPARAQAAPAPPGAGDAITGLPTDYRQWSRTSAGAGADISALRAGMRTSGVEGGVSMPIAGGAADGSGARPPLPLTPYEQAAEQARLAESQRALQAREGGFGFAGSAAPATPGGAVQDIAQGVAGSIDHGMSAMAGAGLQQSLAARDSDNRQDDKANFAEKDRGNSWVSHASAQTPLSPYTVFAGAVLPGVMITGINSDLPGQIEAQLSQNVYDTVTGKYLLLPQGTKVLGTYDSRITYGQSRVLVVWTRLIRPDGSNIDLEGMPGADLSGYAGEPGKVNRHLFRLLTAVLLGSIIQAGTSAGTSYANPTAVDLARQGAGAGVNEATQEIVRKELNVQPTITVAPGTRFNVFTTRDLILPPYQG